MILLLGFLVSICTMIAVPDNPVVFGILTLLGSGTLLMIPMERCGEKCAPVWGIIVSAVLFIVTRNISDGFLGFEGWNLLELPDGIYRNMVTTYLGFPSRGFVSSDYFPLLPWVFLFLTGYFTNRLLVQKEAMHHLKIHTWKPLEWLGKHSLIIYVIHQPVLYVVFVYFFSRISG